MTDTLRRSKGTLGVSVGIMISRTKKKIIWSVSIVAAMVLLVGIVDPLIAYLEVRHTMCPVSGSTRTETVWFGHFTQEKRNVTALERWLKRREPDFEPTWQLLSAQTYFLGGEAYCAIGRSPAISQLEPILDSVIEKSSDEKIAAFVKMLRNGSLEEQRQMIQAISDEVLPRK